MSNVIRLPLEMPPLLAQQVAALSWPPNPDYAGFPPLEPEHNPAAGEWLRRKRDLIKQASRDDCHEWLVLLGCGINGVDGSTLKLREEAVWDRCADLPALVWCKETRRAMWDRTPFLPSPGECHEVLSAHLAPLLAEIAALERIAAIPAPKPIAPPEPYQIPAWAPEWTKSRAVPGLGTGGADVPSLGESVRRVEQQLAARKKPDDPPEPPDAAA